MAELGRFQSIGIYILGNFQQKNIRFDIHEKLLIQPFRLFDPLILIFPLI